MAKVYIEKERVDHIFVKNTTGAALEQGDFVILGGYSGVVDRSAAAGEMVSLHIEGNLEIQVGAADLAAETNDYAENLTLYYHPTTKKFADATASGYVKVGQIAQNHLSGTAGYITFFKYPLAG
jgi:predicted RecA/RadA family phage recombinase